LPSPRARPASKPKPKTKLTAPPDALRLAAIVQSSDDAIISKDLDGVITTWNRGAERLFGYTAAEAVGRSITFLMPPERLDEEPGILARIRRGESIKHYETVRRRKDGALLNVSLTVSPIIDARGRIVGVSKIARDITASKQAEAALTLQLEISHQMQKKLSLLVEACHALMAQPDSKAMLPLMLGYARQVLTADAYAVWRYDYESARWRVVSSEGLSAPTVEKLVENLPYMPPGESMLGKEALVAEDIETTPWLAPVRHIHREEGTKSLLVASLKIHGEYAGTIVFYYKQRQEFSPERVQVARALGDLAASAITSTETYHREQTARIEAEETRAELNRVLAGLEATVAERTRALTASNQELEAFCYSVSHDLRSPLRAIDGFTQLILKSADDKLNDEEKSHFQRVRAASQRMTQLIDDLLGLSRLTRSEMRMKEVDFTAMAASIADELKAGDPARRVDFRIMPGLKALGDEKLLRIALSNLIGNAWKFTAKKPAARIEFALERREGVPVYAVRDDGAGFDMAYVGNLFRAFQRLHTADEFSGTGIGLATVQRIIQRHGGRIWAEGEVGRGAAFFFTLASAAEGGARP
jgi:PAS domain S-box-containing protein